jgi:hypothetical protein
LVQMVRGFANKEDMRTERSKVEEQNNKRLEG